MKAVRDNSDCVVIGGGVSGMTAALLLKRLGREVVLVESAPHLAPLLRGFSRAGLHFDTGFHYVGGLGREATLDSWLRAIGVELDDDCILPCWQDYYFGKRFFRSIPCNLDAWLAEMGRDHPESSSACREFFAQVRAHLKVAYLDRECLDISFTQLMQASESLSKVLASLDISSEWLAALAAPCLLYDVSPEETAFSIYSLAAWHYFSDGSFVAGGGQTLADAFEKAVRKAGIRVLTATRARRVDVEKGRVRGVVLENGESLPCDVCVYTGHPGKIKDLVPETSLRKAYFTHICARSETSKSLLVFAETGTGSLVNHSCYLYPGNCSWEGRKGMIRPLESEEPTVFFSVGDGRDGRYPVNIVAVVEEPPEFIDGMGPEVTERERTWKTGLAERLLSIVRSRVPQLNDIKLVAISSPSDMRRWIAGSTGSLYGMRHTLDSMPILPVTRLAGFWLAGQSIILPGLLGTLVSGAVAVGGILGHERVIELFRTSGGRA